MNNSPNRGRLLVRLRAQVAARDTKKRPPRSLVTLILTTWAPLFVRVVLAGHEHTSHVIVIFC